MTAPFDKWPSRAHHNGVKALLGLILVACGAAPEGVELPVAHESEMRSEALAEEQTGETAEAPPTEEELPEPCVQIDGSALRRWSSTVESFQEAVTRWGFDIPVGFDCQLVVTADSSTLWAETRLMPVGDREKVVILVNPKDAIVDGPECDAEIRLVDALTHELGHVAGLDHPSPEECTATRFAMCPQHRCEETMPTGGELLRAH